MKKPITFVLALLTYASVAQYNNTSNITGNNDVLQPSFVITTKKAESITLSMAYDAPGVPRTDYFVITKHDCNGKVMYNNRIYPNNSTNDGITNVEALIETRDGGMFIAGYHYEDQRHIEQPILIKVDANGNLVPGETHIYDVNQEAIINSEINKISLCRVFDDGEENYFIVGSGDSDNRPGRDVVTTVIKVDKSGSMMWYRKYYSGNKYESLREYPGDIEFSVNDKVYMIAGYRFAAGNTKEQSMYFLEIDRNGDIMQPFRTVISKSVPIDQDMVYDQDLNTFAVVFTHEKDDYVPGTSSVIGFLKIDAAMNISDPKYLWHKEGSAHNGRSISLSSDNNKTYVICSGIYDPEMKVHNPAWQRIIKDGRVSSGFMRYNIKDEVIFGHHQYTYNCKNGREEFVLVNKYADKEELRVIRTDLNGEACGARRYEPRSEKYEPEIRDYDYSYKEERTERNYDPKEEKFDPKVRECKDDADGYRLAAVTGISQVTNVDNVMLMYPSVMSLSDARLTVENNSDAAVKIDLYNIAGQLVLSNSQVAAGKSDLQLNTNGNLSQGLYLLKVYDAKGALTSTTKLLITK